MADDEEPGTKAADAVSIVALGLLTVVATLWSQLDGIGDWRWGLVAALVVGSLTWPAVRLKIMLSGRTTKRLEEEERRRRESEPLLPGLDPIALLTEAREAQERAQGQYLDDAIAYCVAFRKALHEPGGGWINQHTGRLKPIKFREEPPTIDPPEALRRDFRRVARLVEETETEARLLCEAVMDPKKWQVVCHRHDEGNRIGDAAWVHFADERIAEMTSLCEEVRSAHSLPGGVDGRKPKPAAARRWPQGGVLELDMARYGAGNDPSKGWRGVMDILPALINNNTLRVRVSNETMGGDPCPDVVKSLEVRYAIGGIEGFVAVAEGDELVLPPE